MAKFSYKHSGKLYEHRRVWAEIFGPIPVGYDIHHIDGDIYNNDIENLRCISHSEHIKLHRTGKKITPHNKKILKESIHRRWAKFKEGIPVSSQRCSKCKEVKDFSCFYTNKAQLLGYAHYCKECQNKYRKQIFKETEHNLFVGQRKCGKCGQTFDINCFPKNKAQYGGYGHYCKLCQKEANSKYREKGGIIN